MKMKYTENSWPVEVQMNMTTAHAGEENESHDIWLYFDDETGKSAGISIAALAEKSGPIVRAALLGWASQRCHEFHERAIEREANPRPH